MKVVVKLAASAPDNETLIVSPSASDTPQVTISRKFSLVPSLSKNPLRAGDDGFSPDSEIFPIETAIFCVVRNVPSETATVPVYELLVSKSGADANVKTPELE